MKTTFIYFLRDPMNPNKGYVGKSNNPAERFRLHFLSKERCYRTNWIKSLAVRGLKPILEVVDEVSAEYWPQLEVAYIEFFLEQGYHLVNGNAGGEGGHSPTAETRAKLVTAATNRKMSPEFRAAQSIARSGEKNPMFGKKRSQEFCDKMSAVHRGKRVSLETRAKQSAARLGKIPWNKGKSIPWSQLRRERYDQRKIQKENHVNSSIAP